MHGIILRELKKYVEATLGKPAWTELLEAAGFAGKVYLPVSEYSDAEMFALVNHASTKIGTPVDALLQGFGEFIVPDLVQIYRTSIAPAWTTLDLLEHTEAVIHHAVRMRDSTASPPQLAVVRSDVRAVEITYSSQRKLCAVAKGIVRGVAQHYGERVEIVEATCMHQGAPVCLIQVTKLD